MKYYIEQDDCNVDGDKVLVTVPEAVESVVWTKELIKSLLKEMDNA